MPVRTPFDWRTQPHYRGIVFVDDPEIGSSVHDIIPTPHTAYGLRALRRRIIANLPIFAMGETCRIVYEDSTTPDVPAKDVTHRFAKAIADNTIGS